MSKLANQLTKLIDLSKNFWYNGLLALYIYDLYEISGGISTLHPGHHFGILPGRGGVEFSPEPSSPYLSVLALATTDSYREKDLGLSLFTSHLLYIPQDCNHSLIIAASRHLQNLKNPQKYTINKNKKQRARLSAHKNR